jgi:site-specific DNA recombinase
MGATYACKGSKRFRYYVSRPTLIGDAQLSGSLARIPAAEIESQVSNAVRDCLAIKSSTIDGRVRDELLDAIERVTVSHCQIEIELNEASVSEGQSRTLTLPWAPTASRRRRQIIQGVEKSHAPTRAMRANAQSHFTSAMRDARLWLNELLTDPNQTIETMAAREHKSARSLRMTLSLAFLSPELVRAALEGCLPRGLNVKRMTELPMLWPDQWQALGLQSPDTKSA